MSQCVQKRTPKGSIQTLQGSNLQVKNLYDSRRWVPRPLFSPLGTNTSPTSGQKILPLKSSYSGPSDLGSGGRPIWCPHCGRVMPPTVTRNCTLFWPRVLKSSGLSWSELVALPKGRGEIVIKWSLGQLQRVALCFPKHFNK